MAGADTEMQGCVLLAFLSPRGKVIPQADPVGFEMEAVSQMEQKSNHLSPDISCKTV